MYALARVDEPLWAVHIDPYLIEDYPKFEDLLDAVYDWLYEERATFRITNKAQLQEWYEQQRREYEESINDDSQEAD